MSTERINKFQPDRTFYLRGFTGFGAAASLCEATPNSFKVYGVFRDQADFAVLVIYDADNQFEHYSVKYLPDFNLSGLVLSFNLSYAGLQPIDSAKYSWIDWSQLDVVKTTGEPAQIRLWDHATLVAGSYSVAQGVYAISAPGGCKIYDRLTLFVNNTSFDFVAGGGESASYVAQTFANSINGYNWSAFSNSSIAVVAAADTNGNLTLKNARAGRVDVSGTQVTWKSGLKFPGIAPGSTIYLTGARYMVGAITSPTTLTLASAAAAGANIPYLAEYGGTDGNDVEVYMVVRPGNQTLAVNNPVLQLTGGNSDNVTGCVYAGAGWSTVGANNYWRGFGRQTATAGDSVTVNYTCRNSHDLYLGTSLFSNRGIVSVTLDGESLPQIDCFLNATWEVVTRRMLAHALPAGAHTVTLTLLSGVHQSINPIWDANSSGNEFVFDYIEAALPSDIPDPLVTYGNVSAALDFDTDATYKVSPQRLLWHLGKLGLAGQMNEYLGVYWWNQRKRTQGSFSSAVITFSGTWTPGDTATISIGSFPFLKAVSQWDTLDTIAAHFVYYINAASVSTWAAKTGPGQLTVHMRSPLWTDSLNVSQASNAGAVSYSGSLAPGVDGTWVIDTGAANPINYPVAQWHADLFQAVKAAGLLITTAFSMELVYPPDDNTPAGAWKARYLSGTPVDTATDFMGIFSSQCAPIPNVTNYQKLVYSQMAGLQSAAGLIPWLQFGEFLWWYFSSKQNVAVGYASYTSPISIGLAQAHGFSSGDRVTVSGVQGMTGANGTWTITVTDSTHFTLNGSAANGSWTAGTGTVSGGSMAYYDPVTTAGAQAALGKALYAFTCQDDDPSVNGGADANFLSAQLRGHVDAIRKAVLAQYPNAKFELLYPNDVNNPVCLINPQNSYPQGGRLNARVNLPTGWQTKAGSGLDRLKVEALSWGATYRDLDLALQAIMFPSTSPMSWPATDVAYLVPWFNGACPWQSEYRLASSLGLSLVNFWAYDHLALMSWPIPFPTPTRRSFLAG